MGIDNAVGSGKLPGYVLITGANGELGTRIVRGFLSAGIPEIACHYRSSSESIITVFREFGFNPDGKYIKAELTNEDQVRSMCDEIESQMGPIWGVLNLAGAASNGMSWNIELEEFSRIINSNLISTFLVTKAVIPRMRSRGKGRIINISSIVAHTGAIGAAHYCAAKSGIEGFTKAVALETANKGIAVNCVALGYFDCGLVNGIPPDVLGSIIERIPERRLGSADEIFPLISYLLDPRSAFMTGQTLHLNGGQYS